MSWQGAVLWGKGLCGRAAGIVVESAFSSAHFASLMGRAFVEASGEL